MECKYVVAPRTVCWPRKCAGPSRAEQDPIKIALSVTPGVCAATGETQAVRTKQQRHNTRVQRKSTRTAPSRFIGNSCLRKFLTTGRIFAGMQAVGEICEPIVTRGLQSSTRAGSRK